MTAGFTKTSGDLQADRRYQYALDMVREGDYNGALDLLTQTAALAPQWPVLPYTIGTLLHEKLNRPDEALEWYKKSIALDPQDHQGAALKIQMLGGDNGGSMPLAFVETLFDQYAPRFDTHLTETLEYKVPAYMRDLYAQHKPGAKPQRILDLGCGTGLAAEQFAGKDIWIEGVDISAGMLAEAKKKNIYARLAQSDLQHYVERSPDEFDLILAADVLIYLGDLAPVLAVIKKRLKRGGVFIFSVQKQDNEDVNFHLDSSHRFSYSHTYIQRALAGAKLQLIAHDNRVLRRDQGRDVPGCIYLCG